MQPQQQNVFSFPKILLAGALTLLFLSIYSHFFPPNPPTQQQTSAQRSQQALPQNSAPLTSEIQTSPNSTPEEVLLRIKAKDFDLEIDTLGRIRQVYLKDQKFITPPQESLFGKLLGQKTSSQSLASLPLLDPTAIRPLEVRFADATLNQKSFETPMQIQEGVREMQMDSHPLVVVLKQDLGSFVFYKRYTIYPDLSYKIELHAAEGVQYFLTNGTRPLADADPYTFLGSIIATKEGKLENFEEGDVEGIQEYRDAIFMASVDRYFASVLYSRKQDLGVVVDGRIPSKNPITFASLKGDATLEGYIGAKDYQDLKALYPPLTDVVEYGLVTFFAKPLFLLLELLHQWVGNWGWAIVLLTLIVRIALFPLSYKGMMGMQKLKDIAPQMKELQAKYKNDPQKLQKHMMELYRKSGANPLGGCLPLLLQIPVFFAIYKVLYCAVELKSSAWILWIHDLSAIDPYYVLPLIMGVTMYISQMLTPSSFTDPMQEKVFKMLPIFFTLFFIIFPFPAGLVLYWSVNNLISIAQQILINQITKKEAKQ